MGHDGEFWQNVAYWIREWQANSAFLPWGPNEQHKKVKRYDTKRQTSRSICVLHATGEEQTNISRRNEEAEPKQKQPVVDASGGESKLWGCKEQYYKKPGMLGSWIKVNWKWSKRRWQKWILTLVISEWKWMWMGKFKAYEHYVQYCEQESLRQIRVPIIVSKRAWNSELGCNLKKKKKWQNDLGSFQRQTFSITVIQVYDPITSAKE